MKEMMNMQQQSEISETPEAKLDRIIPPLYDVLSEAIEQLNEIQNIADLESDEYRIAASVMTDLALARNRYLVAK